VVVAGAEFVPTIDRVRDQVAVANWFVFGDAVDGWESVSELLAAGDPGEPDCEVSEEDLALVVYTSGTEAARPKAS
jgi:acyl-coenzyme A synthetase/AMP-(fatty) acid ligase